MVRPQRVGDALRDVGRGRGGCRRAQAQQLAVDARCSKLVAAMSPSEDQRTRPRAVDRRGAIGEHLEPVGEVVVVSIEDQRLVEIGAQGQLRARAQCRSAKREAQQHRQVARREVRRSPARPARRPRAAPMSQWSGGGASHGYGRVIAIASKPTRARAAAIASEHSSCGGTITRETGLCPCVARRSRCGARAWVARARASAREVDLAQLAAEVVVAVDQQRQGGVPLAQQPRRRRVREPGVERDHRQRQVVAVLGRVAASARQLQVPVESASAGWGRRAGRRRGWRWLPALRRRQLAQQLQQRQQGERAVARPVVA